MVRPMPKPLTLDIGPLIETVWTGIPVFTRRLAQSLLADPRFDVTFAFNLLRVPRNLVEAAIRAETGVFLRDVYESGADAVSHPIDPSQPLLYPSVKTTFGAARHEGSVIHDISTLVMPDTHAETNIRYHLDPLAQTLATNSTSFCTSQATEAALTTSFPSVQGKTRLLYQYADWPESFEPMHRNLPGIALGPYALVIGTIEPRKNLSLLLRALKDGALNNSDLKFVIVGRQGWLVEQFLASIDDASRARLIFTGFVSEFVKYRLIQGARFLVFPSLYEGFGIPALEALSLGKPVLASRTSSLPEVVGDAGLYFDPLSVTDFATTLAALNLPDRLTELAALAPQQVAKFTPNTLIDPVHDWLNSLT
jgi:glycosyltransferase involved in cell wall biosynthesis